VASSSSRKLHPRGNLPGTHRTGSWVTPGTGFDALESTFRKDRKTKKIKGKENKGRKERKKERKNENSNAVLMAQLESIPRRFYCL
jgi:hypothetical protein